MVDHRPKRRKGERAVGGLEEARRRGSGCEGLDWSLRSLLESIHVLGKTRSKKGKLISANCEPGRTARRAARRTGTSSH